MPGVRYSRCPRLLVPAVLASGLLVVGGAPAFAQVATTTTDTAPPVGSVGALSTVPVSVTEDFYTAVVAALGVLVLIAIVGLGLRFARRG